MKPETLKITVMKKVRKAYFLFIGEYSCDQELKQLKVKQLQVKYMSYQKY